jgi:uncharacterized protein
MRFSPAFPLLAAIALAVAGCSGQPEKAAPERPPRTEALQQPLSAPEDEVERLLALAARSEMSAAVDAKLQAASELLRRGDAARAAALLGEVESAQLTSAQWIRGTILRVRLELEAGAAQVALERLSNPALQAESAGAERALQVELALLRAEVYAALGRPLESARERIDAQAWLNDETARRDNAQAIVSTLAAVDMATLERAIRAAASDDLRGWLELSAIARDLRRGPGAQSAEFARWERRYALIAPLQPVARELLPGMRERIVQPKRVALLLPLSGKAAAGARAVLEGYLAEYMGQLASGEQPPPVAVIDTGAATGGFAAAYAAAVSDGADMIVGPLLKEELAAFSPALQPTVPTLALNFSDAATDRGAALREFGLDSVDEVAQLAAAARERGFTRALVLADASEASRRQSAEFARLWRERGARLIGGLELHELNEFRRSFEEALLFEQSRQRGTALTRLLGMELMSEPRRRQDLDLVVVFAGPVAARSIRPLVSFLYAGDLPVWATSQSYGARTNVREDRDLDGVRFLDLPWFSEAERARREALHDSVPPGGLQRLAALGTDACRLQSRIGLLDWSKGAGLSGATGELDLDPRQRLHRRSQWYAFDDGIARPEQQREALPRAGASARSTEGETTWTETDPPAAPPRHAPPTSDGPPRTAP